MLSSQNNFVLKIKALSAKKEKQSPSDVGKLNLPTRFWDRKVEVGVDFPELRPHDFEMKGFLKNVILQRRESKMLDVQVWKHN